MLSYAGQVEKAIASHKLSGDYKGASTDEFLSGFMKHDHLMPVVTLTMYFDSKNWDAPMSIHDMFKTQDARILSLVPNYKVNLITPASIADHDFEKFKTTLKEVLSFIKYSDDKDKLGELLATEKGFHHLGRNEVDVLNACVGAKLIMKEGEAVANVCLAMEEMKKDAANQGRMTTLLNNIENLMKKMEWSAEQAMDMLDVSENDRKQLSKLLK